MRRSVTLDIKQLLAEQYTATLATVDRRGWPHVADVWFAFDRVTGDLSRTSFSFLSDPDSGHARQIQARGQVALTVHAATGDYQQIHGLQLHGRCEMLGPREKNPRRWDAAWRAYLRRYPFVGAEPFRSVIVAQRFFVIRPTWWRWMDNRRGFGFKVEGSG